MGSYSLVAQGEGRKFLLALLVFGGLSISNVHGGSHEADNEPSQSHFLGAGANEAHVGNHGKYFQDFYSLQYGPNQLEFGHVCEDPSTWEQRFERKDLDKQHHQGQVRWGDKHGGYGEHYWDYNHAGHHDGGDGDGTAPVAEYAEVQEAAPQNQQPFQAGAPLAQTATAIQKRPSTQQHRHPSPSDGYTSPQFVSRVNPVKLPKAQLTSASQLNEKGTESRLPSSWSPIPTLQASPIKNKPLTGHQLSRIRRSHRLSTRIFDRTHIDKQRTA